VFINLNLISKRDQFLAPLPGIVFVEKGCFGVFEVVPSLILYIVSLESQKLHKIESVQNLFLVLFRFCFCIILGFCII
jgi:hypothetical protein